MMAGTWPGDDQDKRGRGENHVAGKFVGRRVNQTTTPKSNLTREQRRGRVGDRPEHRDNRDSRETRETRGGIVCVCPGCGGCGRIILLERIVAKCKQCGGEGLIRERDTGDAR